LAFNVSSTRLPFLFLLIHADDLALQHAADSFCAWSNLNGMAVNENKTKEMVVHFGRNYHVNGISTVCMNIKHIVRVQTFKLLGVYIGRDL
jgi:hypothetical protein